MKAQRSNVTVLSAAILLSTMKALSLFMLLYLASMSCLAAPAVEPMVTGDWSKPVNGIRGRLLFAEDTRSDDTCIGIVYLELQNVSDRGNPIEIYYDEDHPLPCELFDASNKPIEQAEFACPYNRLGLRPYWLILLNDSTLRLPVPVSVSVEAISKHNGVLIHAASTPGDWFIRQSTFGKDCFLVASFVVNPVKDKVHLHPWYGSLKLPKLRIPTAGKKLEQIFSSK